MVAMTSSKIAIYLRAVLQRIRRLNNDLRTGVGQAAAIGNRTRQRIIYCRFLETAKEYAQLLKDR